MELDRCLFGSIWCASGVRNFFDGGYWFHLVWKPFGLRFEGVTFVSKTTTLQARKGNMALNRRYSPRYPFPRSVRVKPLQGLALNAVGLSGPGLAALLATGLWQQREDPFWISIMSMAETPEERLDEYRRMAGMIGEAKSAFKARFGLQINLSCPNGEHDPSVLIGESAQVLDILSVLGVPLMPKYSIASAPVEAVMLLNDHPACSGICVSNTLPYGWNNIGQQVWGRENSPLAHLRGGGISGSVLSPLVCDWISRLRYAGFQKHINGGGGILTPHDVNWYRSAGASSVFIGTVAMVRPWRVRSIVKQAHSLNWR